MRFLTAMKFWPIFLLFFGIQGANGECRDLVPCQRAAGYCRMPHLVQTLSINCPATCGYCQQQAPSNPNPVQNPVQNPIQTPGYPNNGNYNPYPGNGNPYPGNGNG
jgi:hypothetical protein